MSSQLLIDLFSYVLLASSKYNIDPSHSEAHSMNILHYVNEGYNSLVNEFPILVEQKTVIYCAAILHDMCDKKYMPEEEGLKDICDFLKEKTRLTLEEIDATKYIIETMSYSKVKKDGFPPNLGIYEQAYHLVRESDLLCSYDFDRCIVYGMNKGKNFMEAYSDAEELFENRVFKYKSDGFLLTSYAQNRDTTLTQMARRQIYNWKQIIANI
jgi:hypothetical protein